MSIEDQTGYTYDQGTGSFVDDASWFSGEALGSELVTNGTFDANITGWTNGGAPYAWDTWEWDASGALHVVTDGSTEVYGDSGDDIAIVSGTTYKLSVHVTITSGTLSRIFLRPSAGGGATYCTTGNITTTGIYTKYFTGSVTENIVVEIGNNNGVAVDALIDNVSVKAVTSLATQSLSGKKLIASDDTYTATGYIGSAEAGEALGSDLFDANKGTFTEAGLLGAEAITAQNDRDFNTDIGNWVKAGSDTGTLAYDTTNLGYTDEPDADDDQALLTAVGDGNLFGAIPHTSLETLTANTLYKVTAWAAVPAENTLKRVTIGAQGSTFSGSINSLLWLSGTTIAGDTWTEVTEYVWLAADVEGNFVVGFDGDPSAGDLLYFSDISIKPLTLSWVPYGTNTLSIDSNALKITYVDNGGGASLLLQDSKDLSSDLTATKQYKLTGQAKVSAGNNVSLRFHNGDALEASFADITSTSYIPFEHYFVKGSGTPYLRLANMGAGEIIWLDSLVLTEVTAADAQAVTIYKERGLATEGWLEIEAGFDYNSITAFDVYNAGGQKMASNLNLLFNPKLM